MPDCGLPWRRIRPPVDLESWPFVPAPEEAPFTTVSSWMGGADGEWVVWTKLAELKEAWQKPLRW